MLSGGGASSDDVDGGDGAAALGTAAVLMSKAFAFV
jgi:hypothetical protein